MKLNKRVMGLILVGMLSVGVVGCGNNEVEYQESQVQQEQVIDEDLTPQYEEKINKKEELELAKLITEESAKKCMAGFRYEVKTHEETNTVMITVHLTKIDVAKSLVDGSYYELVNIMVNTSTEMRNIYVNNGMDVNCSLAIGDTDEDRIWFATLNNTILYDCSEELN